MNGKTVSVIAIGAIVALGGAYLFMSAQNQDILPSSPNGNVAQDETEDWNTYTNEEFGFEFRYPKIYFLEEREVGDARRANYFIMLTEDTEENRLVREGKAPEREGPLAITFDIYQNNLDKLSLVKWLTGTDDSNFKLGNGTYGTTTISGREAVVYKWSGLYVADNIAFEHADSIFSVAVTYMNPDDEIRKDFPKILATLRFSQ